MKRIPLTRGQFALVDDDDFEWLSQWKWYASYEEQFGVWRARRTIYPGKSGRPGAVLMHRAIMKAPPGLVVDHINHNGLDNRKENLRCCSDRDNRCNALNQRNSTSGYKGVSKRNPTGVWRARVTVDGRRITVGNFPSAIEAARAYDAAALKHYGEFACTNASLGLL